MHVGILLKIEVSSREFRKQGNICMGKIGYPVFFFFCFYFFFFKEKGNLSVPIFRTCAVLLSFLDDGVRVVIRSVQIYDLEKTAS